MARLEYRTGIAREGCYGIWDLQNDAWLLDSGQRPRWFVSCEFADDFRARFHPGDRFESRPMPAGTELTVT